MGNKYNKNNKTKFILRMLLFTLMFFIVLVVSIFTKLPKYFDSYVIAENFRVKAWLWLIIYRLIMYFSFPIIITIIEKKRVVNKNKTINLLIKNYNAQFAAYALLASVYVVFGIDKVLGVDLFSNADSFLFITSFAVATIFNKNLPKFIVESEETS